MPAGSVSVVLAACETPAVSAGTLRLPSRTSAVSSVLFVDR